MTPEEFCDISDTLKEKILGVLHDQFGGLPPTKLQSYTTLDALRRVIDESLDPLWSSTAGNVLITIMDDLEEYISENSRWLLD